LPYDITLLDELGLVLVRYHGSVDVAQRSAALQATLHAITGTGYRRVLVDFDHADPSPEPLATVSAFATRLATDPVLRSCRIAFLGHERQRFNTVVETLSLARGYGARRFHDRTAAMQWLLVPQGRPCD